jgi:hypothetical protein
VIAEVAGAVLLVAAVAAMAAAASRVASLTGARGLELAVAAAPLGVAAAVTEALALGTVGLGGSQLALGLAAGATWLAAWRWAPARPAAARPDSNPSRLATAALAGLGAGWVVWQLRFPQLGLDGSTYHLAAVADWVTSGATGHSEDLYVSIPVGSYPLTNEVALAWAVGIAHSWAPVAAWSAAIAALLAASCWLGLRRLDVKPALAALAILTLAAVPVVLRGLVHSESDAPALAWLACTAALATCARTRPALLAPMLVASALAIGTKTTVLPLTAIVVLAAAYMNRASLRRLARPLTAAAALGLAAGGIWYLRNLVAHGSPLWPFVSAPWGDPVPPLLDRVNFSLLERPKQTLEGQWPIYRLTLSGGLVLLAGGLLAPLWARRRPIAAAAAVTLAAVLAWASAPFTGAGAAAFLQVNTLRYLIPALAAAALAIALSSRYGTRTRALAAAALAAALIWSAKTYVDDAYLQGEGTLILAAAITAATTALALAKAPPRTLPLIAAVCAAALLIAGGHSYTQRHAQAGDFDSGVVSWFTTHDHGDRKRPIAFSPTPIAPLAGNRLTHPLTLIDANTTCKDVLARLARGWIVVRDVDRALFGTLPAEQCLAGVKPAFDDGVHRVYGSG